LYPETYDWYMSNIVFDSEMGPRTVGAALRPKPLHVEPPTPVKKYGATHSVSSHYGVDGLWYIDPQYVDPQNLAKHFLSRSLSAVTSGNIDRTFESLEVILPRILRFRGL
jgi:hypothetical protein